MKIILLFFIILTFSLSLHAQIFRVEVTDYGGLDSIGPLKNFIDQELMKYQNKVNEDIPNGSPARIMRGMANASTLASSGANADYSSNLETYLIGVSMTAAADLDKKNGTKSDVSGVGLAPSLLIGGNLDRLGISNFAGLDTKRLNSYVNFMKIGYEQNLTGALGYDAEAGFKSTTIGFKFQYLWKEGKEYRHASWGGLKLHWGYQYNETKFIFNRELDEVVNLFNGQQNFNGRLTGRPEFGIDVNTHSIPLELSTDITIFKFLSFFGGAGVNFNIGKAKGSGNADIAATPLVCTDGGTVCGGGRILQMQVKGAADVEDQVNPFTARAFLGAQINLPHVQLYGQLDNSLGTEVYGASVGLRYVH
jgi:hypothetical protein